MLWRTLHTPHFAIHYHEPLGVLARHLAGNAEQIHARVEKSLGLASRGKVQVVLTDRSDSANGSAGVLPYNAIRLHAAAPDDMAPLGDYEDWLTLLLTHEHSHILHLNEASGVPRFLQRLFGRFYTPQQFLPRWIVEGIATYQESALTAGGRGRARLFEMYLRMDALEDRMLGLDMVTHDGEPWPHGNVRYLYGEKFMHFVADRHGPKALGRFAIEYGRRLVPYGLSRAMKRATGQDIVSLYEDFLAYTREQARRTQAEVTAQGLREGRRLTWLGERVGTPRFLPDGRVLFYASDGRRVPDLRTVDLKTGELQSVTRVRGSAAASVARSTGDIIYSNSAPHLGSYSYRDLFIKRASRWRSVRLTRGMRAREPDVSPDGKQVAFVQHGAGTSHLTVGEVSAPQASARILVRSRRMEQVFTPRWSPDAKRIAYSGWQRGGYRDIWLVDVETGARTRVTHDRAMDRQPAWSPDGRTLYFSSDRTGIANLYAHSLATGETRQVTNVLGGAFMPELSPDGRSVVYVGYTSLGFDLYELALPHAAGTETPAGPIHDDARPPAQLPMPAVASVSAPYNPWPTLLPRSYGLSLENATNGQQLVLDTSAADAVGWHAWALTVATSLEDGTPSVSGEYALRKLRMPLILRGAVRHQERRDLFVSGVAETWLARLWSLTATTRISLPRRFRNNSLALDYTHSYLEAAEEFDVQLDPSFQPPRLPPLGRDATLGLNWTYSSVQRQVYDVSSSWGQRATMRLSLREPRLGSRRRSQGLSWGLTQFVPMGWQFGALAFRYAGGWNSGVRLGGFASELVPVLDALVGGVIRPSDSARIRGFPARFGDQFHVAQLEYRFLLFRILRGLHTLPAFARRVHAAIFADVGDAYRDRRFDVQKLGVGVGGELRIDFFGAYSDAYTLRAGLVKGVTEGGEWQWYTSFARPY